MKPMLKRVMASALLAGALMTLGGCVYGPGYYQRPGVAYDDGYGPAASRGSVVYDDDYYYAGPSYYAPAYYPYYSPWYGFGGPWLGLSFYGSYHGGYGHHWHGGPSHGGGHSHH